tara:strand:- start:2475 stop:3167 length:693 start_codon:yes stop_codon:yes gene_type:complete
MTGSEIAKSGFKVEHLFITALDIKTSLDNFFNKQIKKIILAPPKKKFDIICIFDDDTKFNIQLKKIINFGSRGNSFDRRHICNTFENPNMKRYLTLLSLSRPTKRSTLMSKEQKKDFILLGNNHPNDVKQYLKNSLIGDEEKNDYFCIIKTNKKLSEYKLYIIKSEKLYESLEKSIDINISMKRNGTCLHLTPNIYLQRKGGGKSDRSPNHIQAKLKITRELLTNFNHIL